MKINKNTANGYTNMKNITNNTMYAAQELHIFS